MLFTKPVATEHTPNPRVMAGKNHPGPIHLQAICTSLAAALGRGFVGTDIAGNLEQNVGDEEDRQDGVVVISLQTEVFLEAGEFRITCVEQPTQSA